MHHVTENKIENKNDGTTEQVRFANGFNYWLSENWQSVRACSPLRFNKDHITDM